MTDEHLQYHHRSTPGPPRRPAPPPAPGPRPRPADPGRQGRRFREGAAQPGGRARLQPVDPAAGAARPRSPGLAGDPVAGRSEEHTSELQSLMRISYAVFCLKKKKINRLNTNSEYYT